MCDDCIQPRVVPRRSRKSDHRCNAGRHPTSLSLATGALLTWGLVAQSVIVAMYGLILSVVHLGVTGNLDPVLMTPSMIVLAASLAPALLLQRGRVHAARGTKERNDPEALASVLNELRLSSAALESAGEAIMITDREGQISWVNTAFESLTGYARGQVIGRTWRILDSGMHDAEFFRGLRQTILSGSVYRGEIITRRKDGSQFPAYAVIAPVRDSKGGITHFVEIQKDITLRKHAAEEQTRRIGRLKLLSDWSLRLFGEPAAVSEDLLRMLAELFDVPVVYVGEIGGGDLALRGVFARGQVGSNPQTYPLMGTPCAAVAEAKDIRIYDYVAERFPNAPLLREHRAFSYCGCPALDAGGLVVAVVALIDEKPREFSQEDQEILRMVAQRIASEVERGKAIAARQRASQHTLALLSLSKQISGTLDTRELLEDVQRRVCELLSCEAVVFLSLDQNRSVFCVTSCHGVPPDLVPAALAVEIPCGEWFDHEADSNGSLVVNDVREDDPLAALRVRFGTGPLAAVALCVRGQLFGRLCAIRGVDGSPFQADEVELLSGIGHQLANGLEVAHLYEEQHREARVTGALARVGQELIATLNSSTMPNRLCEVATQVLECDFALIAAWDAGRRVHKVSAIHGLPADLCEVLLSIDFGEEMTGYLQERLDAGSGSFETVPSLDPSAAGTLMAQHGVTRVLFVALIRLERPVGVLSVGYRGRSQSFTSQQLRIASGIGQIVPVGMAHAQVVQDLERANHLKSDFLATMSHELRTPLNIILGYNDLLLDGAFGALVAEQNDALRRMRNTTTELVDLINATLDVSRLELGSLPLNIVEVDPSRLLRSIGEEAWNRHQKSSVTLAWNIEPEMPCLWTDASKLGVILKNLLSNALKCTEAGRVVVSVRQLGDGIELAVADTGVGIAAQEVSVFFEPFRQGDGALNERHGGVGLGLYIVRRLVELMGGTIHLRSEVGHGSTFRVRIPSLGGTSRSRSTPPVVPRAAGALTLAAS